MAVALACGLMAAGWGHGTDEPGPDEPSPNVILISIDTLRADHMGSYGYGKPTSPFMDSLAGQGVRFANAHAQASWTLPSHMSIFTSLPPYVHGEGTGRDRERIHAPTIAGLLRNAGFKTGAFTENAAIDSERGFARGFAQRYPVR